MQRLRPPAPHRFAHVELASLNGGFKGLRFGAVFGGRLLAKLALLNSRINRGGRKLPQVATKLKRERPFRSHELRVGEVVVGELADHRLQALRLGRGCCSAWQGQVLCASNGRLRSPKLGGRALRHLDLDLRS